jgi:hypothetical protein
MKMIKNIYARSESVNVTVTVSASL